MRTNFLKLTLLFLLILCGYSTVHAQELAGSLNGTVTDSTGAVVSGATVVIEQNGTKGTLRKIETDQSGNYSATNLTPSTYTVTVTAPGFKTYSAKDLTIFVAQKRTLNAVLAAGSLEQTVTVEENAVAVETSSSAQAGTISGTQVRELELSNRNFEQLVTLQPGVVSGLGDETGFGLNNTTTLSVNGARSGANNWTVDGSDINDSGSNTTLLNVPSVDAIQEFTLERGTYDAGYGRSGGAQVLVATKSGTSAYHGDIYEFFRNDALNANDYFSKQAGDPRAVERYNNYGFTLGGPLWVPKLYNRNKDKTFFFWSEEWRKVSSPQTNIVTAPSQDQLNGIVAGQLTGAPAGCVSYDAAADQSTISPACYSKNAQVYLTNVFDPNVANVGGNNVQNYSAKENFRQDIVRIDHNFTDKLHFFARAMQDDNPSNFPTGLFAGANYPGLVNTAVNAPGENVVGNLTYTISPKVVNEAEFAYSQGTIQAGLSGVANSASVAGALTPTAYIDPYGRIPSISFTGGTITGLSQGSAPYDERNLDRTFFDNLSLNFGKHSIRVGGTVSQMLKTENASEGAASFQFNTWQDFLLGNVAVFSQQSTDIVPDLHYYNFEGFAQDDWKLNRRLTLNLGIRYSYFPSPTDAKNTLNNFSPDAYVASAAPAIDPATGDFVAGQTQIPATYTNGIIFPAGAACTAAKNIASGVTCSPFGARVNPNSNRNFAPRVGFAYDVFGDGKTSFRGGFGIFFDRTLNGIWEQNAFSDPPLLQTTTVNNTSFDTPLAGTSVIPLGPNSITTTGTPTFKVPSYASYNLSIQQEVRPGTTVEFAYVGSTGRHLLGEVDLNQPTVAARLANPKANVNAIRPFLGYSYFKSRVPAFTSDYNSLQISASHRVTAGLTLGIAYTWSKNMTNQSNDRGTASTDTYDKNLDYGVSSLNTPHIFIANYVYQLPFFKAQKGIEGKVLGGWEVSGITSVESGQSLTVTQANDPFAGFVDGPGSLPTNGLGSSSPNGDIAPRPDQIAPVHLTKTQGQWFTVDSFAHAQGHFGTEHNGAFYGPGLQNWDLGAIKNVDFLKRYKFQFRAEFFNAFNHTNFSSVDTGVDDGSPADKADTHGINFGTVNGTHQARRIQFGSKIYF